MGGDLAPQATVQGAVDALKSAQNDLEIILVGNENQIITELHGQIPNGISIHPTTEVVSMQESGSKVIKSKPNSSLVQGIQLVKNNDANAFVSAGNTGAVMATSLFLLGRIPRVKRPCLGIYLQTETGGKIICDVGANPDAKPEHLLQFAIMASVYLDHVEGIKDNKVALINIGKESSKGSDLYQETHHLLQQELQNFVGNVETRYFFDSIANVFICDGFVGNNLIKFAEGWVETSTNMFKEKIKRKIRYKIGAKLIKPIFKELQNQYDYEEHGGAPLLGVNGISIVSHGSSTPKAIMNSILLAQKSFKENLILDISKGIDEHLGAIS